MDENHERTKDVLENIDQEADAIKKTVYESQRELKETLDGIMEKCGIVKKQLHKIKFQKQDTNHGQKRVNKNSVMKHKQILSKKRIFKNLL